MVLIFQGIFVFSFGLCVAYTGQHEGQAFSVLPCSSELLIEIFIFLWNHVFMINHFMLIAFLIFFSGW